MNIAAITPHGSSYVRMLRRANTSWSIGVEGDLHPDVRASAEKAVHIALAEVSTECKILENSTRDCYDITFAVDGEFVKDASADIAFPAFYVWDIILRFLKAESK